MSLSKEQNVTGCTCVDASYSMSSYTDGVRSTLGKVKQAQPNMEIYSFASEGYLIPSTPGEYLPRGFTNHIPIAEHLPRYIEELVRAGITDTTVILKVLSDGFHNMTSMTDLATRFLAAFDDSQQHLKILAERNVKLCFVIVEVGSWFPETFWQAIKALCMDNGLHFISFRLEDFSSLDATKTIFQAIVEKSMSKPEFSLSEKLKSHFYLRQQFSGADGYKAENAYQRLLQEAREKVKGTLPPFVTDRIYAGEVIQAFADYLTKHRDVSSGDLLDLLRKIDGGSGKSNPADFVTFLLEVKKKIPADSILDDVDSYLQAALSGDMAKFKSLYIKLLAVQISDGTIVIINLSDWKNMSPGQQRGFDGIVPFGDKDAVKFAQEMTKSSSNLEAFGILFQKSLSALACALDVNPSLDPREYMKVFEELLTYLNGYDKSGINSKLIAMMNDYGIPQGSPQSFGSPDASCSSIEFWFWAFVCSKAAKEAKNIKGFYAVLEMVSRFNSDPSMATESFLYTFNPNFSKLAKTFANYDKTWEEDYKTVKEKHGLTDEEAFFFITGCADTWSVFRFLKTKIMSEEDLRGKPRNPSNKYMDFSNCFNTAATSVAKIFCLFFGYEEPSDDKLVKMALSLEPWLTIAILDPNNELVFKYFPSRYGDPERMESPMFSLSLSDEKTMGRMERMRGKLHLPLTGVPSEFKTSNYCKRCVVCGLKFNSLSKHYREYGVHGGRKVGPLVKSGVTTERQFLKSVFDYLNPEIRAGETVDDKLRRKRNQHFINRMKESSVYRKYAEDFYRFYFAYNRYPSAQELPFPKSLF
jgi:hypothetical protein